MNDSGHLSSESLANSGKIEVPGFLYPATPMTICEFAAASTANDGATLSGDKSP